ncbi:Oidioi.mRNA.OKI2018_I69.PAR.g9109.t1.cds [Oikopleura dioica]|uniref:Cytidine deaminase n=1 Tax=Oikopleura dioica TaxID=34765 RepID=A0ABN7RN84_OIKDI|nr:Oidioi.mRNA.OKI2018_I69.PAR.g9109.t1.cds [Oikopleura dioica]
MGLNNEPVILEEAEVKDQKGNVISTEVLKDLVAKAKLNLEKSYCSYSKFHVGASLLTVHGQFDGVNVENASYGLTICAERSAMCSAISQFGKHEFRAIAIATTSPKDDWPSPCGACRQFLVEFGDFPVILSNNFNEKVKIIKTKELLPNCFCPDDM